MNSAILEISLFVGRRNIFDLKEVLENDNDNDCKMLILDYVKLLNNTCMSFFHMKNKLYSFINKEEKMKKFLQISYSLLFV